MEAWEKWWKMAQDSLASALLLQQHGQDRASASRSYYSAYQAATALLLYQNLIPPQGREAWSHDLTPDLLRNIPGKLLKTNISKDIALRLEGAYDLRLIADYISGVQVDEVKLKVSLKSVGFIYKVVRDILSQEEV